MASAALVAPAAAQDAVRSITINSTGEVSVEPDMATVIIAVQADAEIAADALDQASAATSAILVTLDIEGVASGDIRSGAIRLSPRYSSSVLSSGNQIVGYQALNSVEVQVNDLAKLGGLLAAVVGDGANRLDGVQFGLQDPSEAMDEARRRAVAEGVRLANLYADAAQVPLGDLLVLSEAGASGYRPVMMESRQLEMAASSPQYDVPTAPGKIELSVTLTMVHAIAD
jgi:uncharacterized protein YggE